MYGHKYSFKCSYVKALNITWDGKMNPLMPQIQLVLLVELRLNSCWSLAPLGMNLNWKSLLRYCNAILCSTKVVFPQEPTSCQTLVHRNLVLLMELIDCLVFKVSTMRVAFKWSQCFIKIMMPVSVTISSKPKNIHL